MDELLKLQDEGLSREKKRRRVDEGEEAARNKPDSYSEEEGEDEEGWAGYGSDGDMDEDENEGADDAGRRERVDRIDGDGTSGSEDDIDDDMEEDAKYKNANKRAPTRESSTKSEFPSRISTSKPSSSSHSKLLKQTISPSHSTSNKPKPVLTSRPTPLQAFASLGVSKTLVASLATMSIRAPTEVQAACIPPLLAGESTRLVSV